jgi:signal transduction histidine kinase/DNA-binding response OmpR family regulator/HPt (histidine-containing phosphotransfer) domain-containing protein
VTGGKRHFTGALDSMPLSTALFGPSLGYLGCNDSFAALFIALSESRPGADGKSPLSFFDLHLPFSLSEHLAAFLANRPVAPSLEDGLNGVDGKYRWLSFRLSRYPIEGGKDGVLCVIEDLSYQKSREEELLAAKEAVEKSMELRNRFIANMSHEIRTPIQTILGMIELLENTKLDNEQEEYVRQAGFSADVLLTLINDILDFSKIEAGKLVIESIDFDPRACIEQAVDMIALEAQRKGLELVLDIAPGFPLVARGDPTRLRQVLVNLIKNAVKFTAAGEVLVSARLLPESGGDGRLRVEVIDSGIGLGPEVIAKLFSSYYQGDTSHTRKYGGTGLGLAISKHLIERMGGDIGARDNDTAGATFSFEIPFLKPDFSLPDESPLLSGRILIVDDRESAREAEASMAASFGFQTDCVSTGEEALERLAADCAAGRPYDICAVDQNMVGMDGWRLAAEISAREQINGVKLILMSPEGSLGSDAKMKLLNWFNGYVAKPVKARKFREALARASGNDIDLEPADDSSPLSGPDQLYPSVRVLVAEDHPVNQSLFRLILENSGCAVAVAGDGQEAVALCGRQAFDLIFMDIQMPRLNGYEAARAIRASGGRMPIIAVTATSGREEWMRCAQAGMNDLLVKPFRKKDIAMMLAYWHEHSVHDPAAGIGIGGEPVAGADIEADAEASVEAATAERFKDGEVFDYGQVVETFLGNEDKVKGLLTLFLSRTKESVRAIDAAKESGDLEAIAREAHSIKGSALNLSAQKLGKACLSLEEAAKEAKDKEIEEAIERLREDFFEFAQYAQHYAAKA